jgi:ribonuclease E
VREKVSFLVDAQPDAAPSVSRPPEPPVPAPAEPASAAATDDGQPRRAGWWSRRFGNGE